MRLINSILFSTAVLLAVAGAVPAFGQTAGLRLIPVGFCQMASLASATQINGSTCQRAQFTGTGSGTNLTVSAVTGIILVGDDVRGTGVPTGTTIISQTSGTTGGAGVYVTSQATTSSSASLTSGGIPPGATLALIAAETQGVRYRDDGAAPTALIGQPIAAGGSITYQGTFSNLQIIQQSVSATADITFYKSP